MTRDLQREITDEIISAMENGCAPWSPDWKGSTRLDLPTRANGELYRGINVLVLWASAAKKGYGANRWMTYKQAAELGGQVRRGERGTTVVKYGTFKRENAEGDTETGRYLRRYAVFNVQQIDCLPEGLAHDPAAQIDTGARSIPELEQFYNSIGATIRIDGSQPRYVPSQDAIYMPLVQQFETAHGFYGTLAHELTHWTGHKRRLDRLNTTNKEGYAFEELVAELGACFLTTQAGGVRNTESSAAYIQSWLQALRNDKKYIFRAAAKAQRRSISSCQPPRGVQTTRPQHERRAGNQDIRVRDRRRRRPAPRRNAQPGQHLPGR